jgi:hypothetical protein
MLVEHRIDDMDEGFVAVEKTVPPGQEITFEPALAQVLTKNFHNAAISGKVIIVGFYRLHPGPIGNLKYGVQSIRCGLIRPHQTEYP